MQPEPCAAPSGWRGPPIAAIEPPPAESEEQVARLALAMPTGQHHHARAEREHRPRERLRFAVVLGPRGVGARERPRLGQVRRQHRRPRQDLAHERVARLGLEQLRAGLRDHHRVDHDRRAGVQLVEASRDRLDHLGARRASRP